MDVFLIPVGSARYELYCEPPPAEHVHGHAAAPQTPGLWASLKRRFSDVLAAAERHRNERSMGARRRDGRWARTKSRALAWIADAVAEQRLLWQLRYLTEARLHFPADMTSEEALDISRGMLARDRERHLRWLTIDSLLLIVSAALILVPGPNLIGYYFAFRVVGHFLAWQGAKQGLDRVRWETTPSEPLADLRNAIHLQPPQRERRVLDIASRLRLDHLARFFERVAVRA
jgi:Mitochondrial K+-H+ exchange-related